jgi:acyl carrier protein
LTKQSILVKLTELFIVFFDDDLIRLNEKSTAGDIEDWDSLAQVGLILLIEKEFKFKFNASEVGNLENVGAMIDLIFIKQL